MTITDAATARPADPAEFELPPACESGAFDAESSEARIVRDVLARVGDKWSLLVIRMLHEHPMRFTELQRSIDGISHRMLTQTLRNLERDGLVTRTSYPEIPPRVEYAATELGRSLALPVLGLVEWASTHHASITGARERFDVTRA
ncbi:DNA-binding HxlR family transcriptional regulator [Agromyces terreus]|uniref:DNA-binding HxlR family transcriptional regulator n=1 Tax=Agromyces terreus TaxID=424795 RepID=A0A9X2H539_9MICO|nr:helix-turn-helix domain-containing protein [Agromyces terreus]MCP2370174.1 DNA-binding HxlR family transcriptional regulator [Agromyces terreus]